MSKPNRVQFKREFIVILESNDNVMPNVEEENY